MARHVVRSATRGSEDLGPNRKSRITLRTVNVWMMPVALLAGCAAQEGPSAIGTGGPGHTRLQERMDAARRASEAGLDYPLDMGPEGVFIFANTRPFCYMYRIPVAAPCSGGVCEWVPTGTFPRYRSKDGRAFADVRFMAPKNLEGFHGATMLERAQTALEKAVRGLPSGILPSGWVPFESVRRGTWQLTIAGSRATVPLSQATFVLVDLSPDAVVDIVVGGTSNNDGLVRRTIESLKTTSDPKCCWSALEAMLKALSRER